MKNNRPIVCSFDAFYALFTRCVVEVFFFSFSALFVHVRFTYRIVMPDEDF